MLPIVLVLLVATSAFAAPSVNLNLVSENDVQRPRDNTAVARALGIIDGGDTNVYILTAEEIINDLASSGSSAALGQAIAILGELSTGRPGDACAAAELINAAGSGVNVRSSLNNYIRQLASSIDSIVQVVNNPASVRYSSGSRGGCAGEGRSYRFEDAWASVFASASPNQVGLINEEYCTAKRLYNAFNARSNNVGAALTASALPSTSQVFDIAGGALSNLVRALASGGNPGQAAAAAKDALIRAVGRVNL